MNINLSMIAPFVFVPLTPGILLWGLLSICQHTQDHLGVFLANIRQILFFPYVSSGSCLGSLPWLIVSSLLLVVVSWTLNKAKPRDAGWLLKRRLLVDVFAGFPFLYFHMLREVLAGWPLLGRFTTASQFLLSFTARTVGRGSVAPHSFRNDLGSVSRLTGVNVGLWVMMGVRLIVMWYGSETCQTLSDVQSVESGPDQSRELPLLWEELRNQTLLKQIGTKHRNLLLLTLNWTDWTYIRENKVKFEYN